MIYMKQMGNKYIFFREKWEIKIALTSFKKEN